MDIAKTLNADRHDVIKWLEVHIYGEKYPKLKYKNIQKVILSIEIKKCVKNGKITPNSILQDLTGFLTEQGIKYFYNTDKLKKNISLLIR